MRTLVYLFLPVLLCVSAWSRDPEEIDRGNQFKRAVESAQSALARKGDTKDQRIALQTALRALLAFTKQYPGFQADSIAVRTEAIRLRLKVLAATETSETTPAQLPTTLALYNQMELLLLENIRLRDELYAEKGKQTEVPTDIGLDLQEALKAVAELQQNLNALQQRSKKQLERQAKEINYLNSELKKLSTVNLEVSGESERRAKMIDNLQAALKNASEKTFTKEDEFETLRKEALQLRNEVSALRLDNEQAHTVIQGLKAGSAEALKKKYEDTRQALLKQSALIGKEREAARAAEAKMVDTQKALDVLQVQNSKLRSALKLYRQGSDNVIIQELENTVAVYKEKLAAVTKASDDAKKQLGEWKAINVELLRSLNAASSRPQGASTAELRKQIDIQRKLIEQLRNTVQDQQSEAIRLKNALAEQPGHTPTATDATTTANADLTDDQKQEIQLLVQQGKAAAVNGKLEQATAFLEKAMSLDPNNNESKRYLAEVYLKQGDTARAEALVASIELNVDVLGLLTAIHKKTNNTDEYLARLLLAVAAQPKNLEIRMITAQNLRRIKYYKLSEYQLNELWKLKTGSFECAREYYFLYVSMGLEYSNLQKKWYNKALEIDSTRRNELIIQE